MNKEKKIIIFIYKILPKSLISRLFGIIARIPLPQIIIKKIIYFYSMKYSVKKDEYATPQDGFTNFNMFFTRKLKDGVHKIDLSKGSIISPVDGRIQQFGVINGEAIIQAKGVDYTLNNLIPSKSADQFIDGKFITIYLSPGDYHRIHSPASGVIKGFFNIPGKLFTVQEYMVNGLKGLYSINERIISYINTNSGNLAVCKIGAMDVGRISLSYNEIITNKTFRKKREIIFPNNIKHKIISGDELGIFHLGSTIIILFQKDIMDFNNLERGKSVRVGEKIGEFKRI